MKTHYFSGKIKKMAKWPRKLLLCICPCWIPSRLSPGSPVDFIFQSKLEDRRNLCEVSCNICKPQFHEYLADLTFQVTVMFPWSDDQHRRGALRCLPQLVLKEGSSFIFSPSKSFLPPVKERLICDLSSHSLHPKNLL